MHPDLPPTADCWFLSGPTASGKSGLAIDLARRLNAEIISMDSMALYRHMNIGTAKPTRNDRLDVPHHLIDVIEPDEEYSVAQYVEAAERAVSDIAARGRTPLFVGGTPLYLKALLRGIFSGPPADWPLRRQLLHVAESEGKDRLHARLAEIDPQAAEKLHPSDLRRVIRAIEVFEKTGRTISEHQKHFDRGRPAGACRAFVLDWPREELYRRIDQRVDAMFDAGLVNETQGLLRMSRPPGRTASQAVGYREVIDHLHGKCDLPTAIADVKKHTRQFSKRQMTWFRSLSEVRWVPMSEKRSRDDVTQEIAAVQ
ncbi:MAG: tRNA (adenosine(37)-N6)-dimethylallyltransferase MiaA [Planctomycetota bacterium]|nr:MAG: tRNA (adenosine(37)-N6)-dimethylallyltransferase MiaA [Planctomycetota bacterium]